VPALTPNETNTGKTTVTIPPATAVGLWIVIAKTDGPGTIAETNEANNLRTAVIRIGPDLVVTALAAPASVAAGVPFSVTDTTANQGGGNAGASDTQFFLSGDYLLTGTDTPLQARELQTLGAGVHSPGTTNVTVPAGTAPGLYYLIAKADAGSDVDETTETNNVRYVTFRVGGDLTVSALSVPL
jgi:subtilase family serine protease